MKAMKMTFISKLIIILLISLSEIQIRAKLDLCELQEDFDVVAAARVGDYLLMIINYHEYREKEGRLDLDVVRTVYLDEDNDDTSVPKIPKFRAERTDILDGLSVFGTRIDLKSMRYMFSFHFSETETRIKENIINIYLSEKNNNNMTTGVGVQKAGVFRSMAKPDQPFDIEAKPHPVYNGYEDSTSMLNLKLLRNHFPPDVEILDILVVSGELITHTEKFVEKIYVAMVYTSEKLENEQYIYRTHYLRAKEFETRLSDNTIYRRLNWTQDWGQDWGQECHRLENKISSVAVIRVIRTDDNFKIRFAEFFPYVYRKFECMFTELDLPGPVFDFVFSCGELKIDKQRDRNRLMFNCPLPDIKLNQTAMDLLPFEGKPYDPNRCINGFKELRVITVESCALYDNKYLIIMGMVDYIDHRNRITREMMVFFVRYVDTDKGNKYYETQIMTKYNPDKSPTDFDRVFRNQRYWSFESEGYFDFIDDQNELTFIRGTDEVLANQQKLELIYLNRWNHLTKSIDVIAVEIHYDPSDTNVDNFKIYNHKLVYNHKMQTEDKSGYLNLKLFSSYFPEEVMIKAMIIFRRDINEKVVKYNAFVYTKEVSGETTLLVRHYMKGKPKHYRSVDYNYRRVIWEFDNPFDSCHLIDNGNKGDNGFSGASKLIQYKARTGDAFKVIEFFENYHRVIEVHFDNSSDTFEIKGDDNKELIGNNVFYNCKERPGGMYELRAGADCYANPKFNKRYKRDNDKIRDKEARKNIQDEDEEVSPLFWQLLLCLAVIIAIIGLIGFGLYLRGVERKMDEQDYH